MADERDDELDSGIQVEVVPEAADEKPRLKAGGDTSNLDVRDDEIAGYGREVQGRIKKLRFAFHEERRLRELAQRDSTNASEVAARLYRENETLKRSVQRGEQAVIHQAMTRVDAEIDQARSRVKAAHEAGAVDDIVEAQERLTKAVTEKERLNLIRTSQNEAAETEKAAGSNGQPPNGQSNGQPNGQPPQDERTRDWMSRNAWWGKPGEEERTAFALGVHNRLSAQGVSPRENPDLYWRTIDERLAAVFPDKNGDKNGSDREEYEPKNSRPLAVAGGTRSNTGAATTAARTRVIRLSESQVRVARRLGITPEQYAQQLVIDEKGAANA